MDDEREQIGKRNDSSEVPTLSKLSDFEKKRLKNEKLLKQKSAGTAKFFTELKPKQEQLYMDDDYKDSIYNKIDSNTKCAKASYEPIDLQSTSDIKIKSNIMIPLVHSYADKVIDYNLSKVDLRMYSRNALAKKCSCSGISTLYKYATLRKLYLEIVERKDMLRGKKSNN